MNTIDPTLESAIAQLGDTSSEVVGHVMGTTAHVVAVGSPDADLGLDELRRLEALWTRFSADSELTRLGRGDGAPTIVAPETALLIDRSEWAWELTDGLFDATLLDAVEAAGYDKSFELLDQVIPEEACGPARSSDLLHLRGAETHESIDADPRTGLVRLPAGVRIDPGGIGKGMAADLVATQLCRDGAEAVLVSVGGDLRAEGTPPEEGWEIELDHHVVGPARINLLTGAVATSTRLGRCWRTSNGIAHHVIDPRCGNPSTGPAVAVSIVATEAWRAEALATAVLVGYGTPGFDTLAPALLAEAGALVTTADGTRHRLGRLGTSFVVLDSIDPIPRPEVQP